MVKSHILFYSISLHDWSKYIYIWQNILMVISIHGVSYSWTLSWNRRRRLLVVIIVKRWISYCIDLPLIHIFKTELEPSYIINLLLCTFKSSFDINIKLWCHWNQDTFAYSTSFLLVKWHAKLQLTRHYKYCRVIFSK